MNGTTLRCGRLHRCGVWFTLIFLPPTSQNDRSHSLVPRSLKDNKRRIRYRLEGHACSFRRSTRQPLATSSKKTTVIAQTLKAWLSGKRAFATRHTIRLMTPSTLALIPNRFIIFVTWIWEGSGFKHRLWRQFLFFYNIDEPPRFMRVLWCQPGTQVRAMLHLIVTL